MPSCASQRTTCDTWPTNLGRVKDLGCVKVESAPSVDMRRLPQIGAPDARIAELAERQYGVVTRRQLAHLGFRMSAIDRRMRAGRLHRLHRGVYAVGHRVVPQEGRWLAGVFACGPEAVLSHRSAAHLWGIRRAGGEIEITTPRKCSSRGGIHRHRIILPADEVTETDGIPVTTVPRTIFDLAAVLPMEAVERAMRDAERLRLDDYLSLEDLLVRHPHRRGVVSIRECLKRRRELPAGVTRGELEARFLGLLDRRGIPRPSPNAWVMLDMRRFQVDCLWRDARLIVELDGYEAHGTRYAFENDRDRDRRLQAVGFRVIHVTWRQLHETPGEIASDLQRLLRRLGTA